MVYQYHTCQSTEDIVYKLYYTSINLSKLKNCLKTIFKCILLNEKYLKLKETNSSYKPFWEVVDVFL